MDTDKINAQVECLHVGQKHRYGDSFYEFKVTTEDKLDRETVINLTDRMRPDHRWQSKEEWQANHFNANKYFSGYCEIIPRDYGYEVTYCLPYTD